MESADLAERVGARVVGAGIGLIAFMVSWLILNRLTSLVWEPPLAPVVAMTLAIGIGTTTGVNRARHLVRRT